MFRCVYGVCVFGYVGDGCVCFDVCMMVVRVQMCVGMLDVCV